MLAFQVVYLLPADSQVTKDVNGVKEAGVEDFECSGLSGESSDVVSRSVERLEQSVGSSEAVGECNRGIRKGATSIVALESLVLQSLDEAEYGSREVSGVNSEAREDSDAHTSTHAGTASDSVSPTESSRVDLSSLFVMETDETLAVGSFESVLGVGNSLLGPD
jgi:hypothetical protein